MGHANQVMSACGQLDLDIHKVVKQRAPEVQEVRSRHKGACAPSSAKAHTTGCRCRTLAHWHCPCLGSSRSRIWSGNERAARESGTHAGLKCNTGCLVHATHLMTQDRCPGALGTIPYDVPPASRLHVLAPAGICPALLSLGCFPAARLRVPSCLLSATPRQATAGLARHPTRYPVAASLAVRPACPVPRVSPFTGFLAAQSAIIGVCYSACP